MSRLAASLCVIGLLGYVPLLIAANPAHPVSDYFRDSAFTDARLSPGGNLVLALNRTDADHQYVTLIDLASETSTDIIVSGAAVEYFSGIQWISADTAIFTDHVGKTDSRMVSMQWLGAKDGKPQTHITTWPQGVYFIDPLSMKDGEVLLEAWVDYAYAFYKVDINGDTNQLQRKTASLVLSPGTARYLLDRNGDLKIKATAGDDGALHYSWCGADGNSWSEFLVTKKDELFNPVFMESDGRKFLVFSNIGRDTVGLFEYDPGIKQFTKTLLAKDDSDVTDYFYDWATRQVTVGVWNDNGVEHYTVLDPRASGFVPALQNAFPGENVTPLDISQDGHELLVYTSSSLDPGAYYAINIKEGKAELLGQRMPWFEKDKLASVQVGDITTQDGFSISYLLTMPQSNVKAYPLVVIPHGGPIGIFDKSGFDNESQLFANRGYAVLKVNYRGSGGSGKKFENAGKKEWGRKIEDDIEEAVRTVSKSYPIDAKRICIYGASYGGYSALMSMIRNPQLYKCAATYAGVTDLPLLYDSSGVQFDKRVRDEMADIIGNPTTDNVQLESYSPVYLAEKIQHPVLIGQGLQDTRVDPEHAYRLKLMLDIFKKPYEFYTYDEEGHGFYEPNDATDFYTHLLDFMDQNIGEKQQSMPASAATSH